MCVLCHVDVLVATDCCYMVGGVVVVPTAKAQTRRTIADVRSVHRERFPSGNHRYSQRENRAHTYKNYWTIGDFGKPMQLTSYNVTTDDIAEQFSEVEEPPEKVERPEQNRQQSCNWAEKVDRGRKKTAGNREQDKPSTKDERSDKDPMPEKDKQQPERSKRPRSEQTDGEG